MKCKYACPDCAGRGVEERECGAPHDCKPCLGSGLDPKRVDVAAYQAATANLLLAGPTRAWIEGGELIGQWGNFGCVRITDFLKIETE